jgi:hypothetical protein
LAVVIDLLSKLADDQVVHQLNGTLIFGLFEYLSGISTPAGYCDELAIFFLLWRWRCFGVIR